MLLIRACNYSHSTFNKNTIACLAWHTEITISDQGLQTKTMKKHLNTPKAWLVIGFFDRLWLSRKKEQVKSYKGAQIYEKMLQINLIIFKITLTTLLYMY